MVKLVKQLPAYAWVKSVRGAGDINFAKIIAETGDLGQYDGPAKVWKRMGVGLVDGGRQRRVARDGLLGAGHGFVPRRAATVRMLSDSLVCGNRDGEYRTYYLAEKRRQAMRVETLKHADNRARRHMAKRFLRDLWREWQTATGSVDGE